MELDELLRQQKIKNAELQNKELKIHNREIKIMERDIELKELENKQSFAFLRETRSQLENLVRILREGEITKEKTQGVKKFISDLENSIDQQKVHLEEKKQELESEKNKLIAEEELVAENGMRIKKAKERGVKVILPKDHICATEFSESGNLITLSACSSSIKK